MPRPLTVTVLADQYFVSRGGQATSRAALSTVLPDGR